MEEPRRRKHEREQSLIVALHDIQGYTFDEISKMPQFNVSRQAVHKRYRNYKAKLGG